MTRFEQIADALAIFVPGGISLADLNIALREAGYKSTTTEEAHALGFDTMVALSRQGRVRARWVALPGTGKSWWGSGTWTRGGL